MSSPRIKMIENNIPRIDKESVSEWLMVAPSLPSSGWHELPVQNGDNYETTKHKWLWLGRGDAEITPWTKCDIVNCPQVDLVLSHRIHFLRMSVDCFWQLPDQNTVYYLCSSARWIGSGMSQYLWSCPQLRFQRLSWVQTETSVEWSDFYKAE